MKRIENNVLVKYCDVKVRKMVTWYPKVVKTDEVIFIKKLMTCNYPLKK